MNPFDYTDVTLDEFKENIQLFFESQLNYRADRISITVEILQKASFFFRPTQFHHNHELFECQLIVFIDTLNPYLDNMYSYMCSEDYPRINPYINSFILEIINITNSQKVSDAIIHSELLLDLNFLLSQIPDTNQLMLIRKSCEIIKFIDFNWDSFYYSNSAFDYLEAICHSDFKLLPPDYIINQISEVIYNLNNSCTELENTTPNVWIVSYFQLIDSTILTFMKSNIDTIVNSDSDLKYFLCTCLATVAPDDYLFDICHMIIVKLYGDRASKLIETSTVLGATHMLSYWKSIDVTILIPSEYGSINFEII